MLQLFLNEKKRISVNLQNTSGSKLQNTLARGIGNLGTDMIVLSAVVNHSIFL